MKARTLVLAGIAALALILITGACAAVEFNGTMTADNEIEPYDGPIPPGNPLYGLKIAFEDLDESFTFNETDRFNKQLNNARLRLSEARREFILNNPQTAGEALNLYWQKINITEMRLRIFNASNATGLLHAQEMIAKHQLVLEHLLLSHPNNTGLMRAYNNSLRLEERFEEKTRMKFERVMEKNNRTILRAVRMEVREQERVTSAGEGQAVRVQQTEEVQQGSGMTDDRGRAGGRGTEDQQGQAAQTPSGSGQGGKSTDNGKGRPDKTDDANSRGQSNGRNR